MNKLEMARQLARQTNTQEPFTETSPSPETIEDNQQEKELLNLFQATGKILEIVTKIEARQAEQEKALNWILRDHRKEIRMLIILLGIPLILCILILLFKVSI